MTNDKQRIQAEKAIKDALAACASGAGFAAAATNLFAVMGYKSERDVDYTGSGEGFVERFRKNSGDLTKAQRDFCAVTKKAHGLFQYTEDELNPTPSLLGEQKADKREECFIFVAVELKGETTSYSRSKYAQWTRVVNRLFAAPTIVLFHYKGKITFSFVGRRAHKLDEKRDVLQVVSLLREIKADGPHRGHLDILFALTLSERRDWIKPGMVNFDSLLAAWLHELDVEALNDRFYDDLAKWFQWALETAKFPLPVSQGDEDERRKEQGNQVIRLINRILFIWFLKEKGLVAEQLFDPKDINDCLLQGVEAGGDSYYRAVLQNLFFATLNTENTEEKPRTFRERQQKGDDKDHRVFTLYRYEDLISDKETLLRYFNKTPFVNGGLFECLDADEGKIKGMQRYNKPGGKRVDCFTDNLHQRKQLSVPDKLFFSRSGRNKGLFEILRKYKFAVEENTPIEQEVALDPELLGKVYERLLAHVNDRKKTGTYYTPRAVVEYMVREVIISCFYAVSTPPATAN